MFLKKFLFIIILNLFFHQNLLGKEYLFKWFNNVKILDSINFDDKTIYQLTLATGSWEDSEGNFGFLKCLGPIKINAEGKADLEVICKGYDQLENRFSIKLVRESDYDAGIGEAIYLSGTGRYKSLVDRKCKYAIKYIKEVTKGFYRHICK